MIPSSPVCEWTAVVAGKRARVGVPWCRQQPLHERIRGTLQGVVRVLANRREVVADDLHVASRIHDAPDSGQVLQPGFQ